MAKKDTGSNWWKRVVDRRKGQAPTEEPPAEGEHPQAPEVDDQTGQAVSPPPVEPAEAPSMEEQIDQVSAPPAERKAETTWPPPAPSTPDVEPTPEPSAPSGQPSGKVQGVEPKQQVPESPKPTLPSTNRLPKDLLAYLILIDIGGEMRQARKIPQYFQIQRLRTLAGRHAKAHIHLDDEETVRPEHARIIYQEKDDRWYFTIYPLSEGTVMVNETVIQEGGAVLKSGDLVDIGSAKLVFFVKNLRDEDL